MNNNRGNNRRRGRGNNRPQGSGQQVNRIDSRARGNAPQMLEKYRKLAHDAHLNGDRVTAEYYLQFADHYFRVIADTRRTQDEQRQRRDDRWEGPAEEDGDNAEFSVESDFPSYEQPGYGRPERSEQRPREDRSREDRPREDRQERQRDDRPRDDRPREDRPREEREPRSRRPHREEVSAESDGSVAAEPAEAERSPYEPPENPFVRENRGTRGLKPRRAPRQDDRPRRDAEVNGNVAEPTFDAALLPPSLNIREEAPAGDAGDEPAAPKRRGRKPKAAVEAADEV